jgi:glycosyltransferase involved in cell wall biosynthesis
LIARLISEKGIREYAEAARHVKKEHPKVRFCLVGKKDANPTAIKENELREWHENGAIEYLGYREDVRPIIRETAVYVFPSYREGVPRTVLEAMSMGRPIITTNAPGCRETVKLPSGHCLNKKSDDIIQGENGFLVPVKNIEKLIHAIEKIIDNPKLIAKMGQRSREIAEEFFDVNKINAVILKETGLNQR